MSGFDLYWLGCNPVHPDLDKVVIPSAVFDLGILRENHKAHWGHYDDHGQIPFFDEIEPLFDKVCISTPTMDVERPPNYVGLDKKEIDRNGIATIPKPLFEYSEDDHVVSALFDGISRFERGGTLHFYATSSSMKDRRCYISNDGDFRRDLLHRWIERKMRVVESDTEEEHFLLAPLRDPHTYLMDDNLSEEMISEILKSELKHVVPESYISENEVMGILEPEILTIEEIREIENIRK